MRGARGGGTTRSGAINGSFQAERQGPKEGRQEEGEEQEGKAWKEMEEGEEIAEGERRRGAATEHPSRAGMPGNAAGLFKQRYRSCKQ